MAESYSVKAILSATDNGFSSTLKNAMGAADSLGDKIKSGFNFGFLTGMGQAAFGALANGAKSLIGEIDSSNAAWKNFGSNMRIIHGESKETESMIEGVTKSLQEYAQKTVYSSSDMASTYAQLAAVGTKNTEQLVKGFGGLAAAAENPQQAMKTLSQQATQMAAKPTVAWADFKLMLEQTPAGMAAVAKHMGMTSAELVTAIQDGEVATEDFFAAIEAVGNSDGFQTMATEAKTMGQAMDGLQETVGNKLMPAFDVLSKVGIKAIGKVSDALGNIDAQALADKVTSAVETVGEGFEIFKSAFSGVGESVGSAFSAITEALGITKGEFSKTDALDTFKSACEGVAGAIKTVAGFLEDHADVIAKVLPYVAGLAVAFGGFKILNTVAPGLSSFVGGLALMAAQGLSGLMGKLFGISSGAKAVGDSSATSAQQMTAAAKSFLMIGVGVLAIAAGFALLAQSAIALANAGWPAIAVMAGLVVAVGALTIGMMAMMKTVAASPAQLTAMSTALLALGASVLMIGVGFALLTQSAIALSNAGGLAIGVFVGMVAVIALLAVGAAALGTALTAGAVGFIAFGAAIALVGVGALLAAASLAIIAAVLPTITEYGMQGATAIAALGAGMVVFAAGAAAAGAACLVLGAGLLVAGAGAAVLAAGVLLLSAGCAVAAAALALVSMVLPQIAASGTEGAVAIAALGAGLAVFAVGAGLAGAAALVLGAGLLVASAGILLCAAGIAVIAAGILTIGTFALIAASSFALMSAVLPLVTADALSNAAALAVLAGGLTVLGAAALVAGAGATALAVGIAACAVALAAFSVAMLAMSVATLAASGSIAVLAITLPMLAEVSAQGAAALITLGAALTAFGAGALVAGAAAIVLGAGLTVVGAGLLVVSAAVLVTAAGVLVLASGALVLGAALAVCAASVTAMGAAFPAASSGALLMVSAFTALLAASAALSAVVLVLSAAMLTATASAAAGAVGIAAFGVAIAAAAVGVLAMEVALLAVSASMSTIASDAASAESSLDSMQDSVSIVESGLDALGDMAETAMDALVDAFDGAASDAKTSGKKVADGFAQSMKSGLSKAPAIATTSVMAVNAKLKAGRSGAYSAGAYISQGFAQGMLSCLSVIRNAAAQMAAAADAAVRAKAKIHSPSKVSQGLGSYWGEGFVSGISSMARDAWAAAENLVSIPQLATPDFAMAYGGELSADYRYGNSSEYTIEVPLTVDGKEFARATASYTQTELDKRQQRDSRKQGRL